MSGMISRLSKPTPPRRRTNFRIFDDGNVHWGINSASDRRRNIHCRDSRRDENMIGRLNHVAIAVRDIGKAAAVYRDTLGAEVSAAVPQPDHGVTTVFITLPNTK